MEKPLWYRWARVYASGAAVVMVGVLLFKYTTPTEEQLINSLSPELRAQYEREKGLRRREQEELIKIVKQTAASNDPIWMTGAIKSPWEKGNKMENLKEKYEKELAEKSQVEELERVQRELELGQQKAIKETNDQLKKRTWFTWR